MNKKEKLNVEAPEVQKTEVDLMWDSIKDLDLGLYSLGGQLVSKYCKPFPMEPGKLFLEFDAKAHGMVLPALEELVKKVYNVERMDRFIVVTKK